jgi:Protein kinase domain
MATASQPVGQMLGHYRILEQTGAGGMGVVYRAHDERRDRDVALKVLPRNSLADESARKRFRKEARTLSKLKHANIAQVYDFDTQDGIDFLVMEYVVGVTDLSSLGRIDDALAPGLVVQQTFRWKTSPSTELTRCLQPKWMSGPALLVAPSLIKQICSDIEVSRFSLVPTSDHTAAETQIKGVPPVHGFKLSSDKDTYYAGEGFPLRVLSTAASDQAPAKPDSCPALYLRERSPNGATRIDEVQPLAFKGCSQAALGHESGDWQSGFELNSGANSRWEGIGQSPLRGFYRSHIGNC